MSIQEGDQKEYFQEQYFDDVRDRKFLLDGNENKLVQELDVTQTLSKKCQQHQNQLNREKVLVDYFLKIKSKSLTDVEALKQKITEHRKSQQQNKKQSPPSKLQLKIKILKKYEKYQILQIFCQLGQFTKKYIVLYLKKKSYRHQCYNLIGSGTFGSIFGYETQQKQENKVQKVVAVKCIKFDLSNHHEFQQTVQEFMIADILSQCQIGPKILKRVGFNFVLFHNCMEFLMEICSPVRQQTVQDDLKQSLLKMHLIKIVHSDIKPANIMFSQFHNKNVFIDFGIAQVITEQIWQKTLTDFKGTYQFVGQQMKSLFGKSRSGLINLYMNDASMLSNSLVKIQNMKKTHIKDQQTNKISNFKKESILQKLIKFRFLIYGFEATSYIDKFFVIFMDDLVERLLNEKNERIFRQFHEIYNGIRQEIKPIFLNAFLWKDKDFWGRLIQLGSSFNAIRTQQSNRQNEQAQKHQLSNLFAEFDQDKSSISKKEKNNSNEISIANQQKHTLMSKNNIQNYSYILNSIQQVKRFNQQEYFALFIQYTSFWNCLFEVSVESKQKAACVFQQVYGGRNYQISAQKQQSFTESTQGLIYQLQQQNAINPTYRNLAKSYYFLLTYCMKGDHINSFRHRHLMTILKDCVLMNLNYQDLIKPCMKKYIRQLILSQNKTLLANTVIECFQLIELVESQFKVRAQHSGMIQKNYRQQLNQIYLQLIQEEQVKTFYSTNKQKLTNLQTALAIFTQTRTLATQFESQNNSHSIAQGLTLIKKLQQQYYSHKDSSTIQDYEKAIRMVYFQRFYQWHDDKRVFPDSSIQTLFVRFPATAFAYPLDVTQLVYMRNQPNQQIVSHHVHQIQKKINCELISFYLLLPQKFNYFYLRRNKQQSLRILQMVYGNSQTVLFNLSIFQQIDDYDKLRLYSLFMDNYQFVGLRRRACLDLINHFSTDPIKHHNKIVACLTILLQHIQEQQLHSPAQQMRTIYQEQIPLLNNLVQHFMSTIGISLITCMTLSQLFYLLRRPSVKDLHKHKVHFYQLRLEITKWAIYCSNSLLFLEKKGNNYGNSMREQSSYNQQPDENISQYYAQNSTRVLLQQFHPQKPRILLSSPNQTTVYLLTNMLDISDQKEILSSQISRKIKKLKFTFVKLRMVGYFAQMSFHKLVNKSTEEQLQLFQILVQYSTECCEQNNGGDYTFFSSHVHSLKYQLQTISQGNLFMKNILHFLKQLQTKHKQKINTLTLLPLYIALIGMKKFIQNQQSQIKRFMLKMFQLFDNFSKLNKIVIDQAENVTLKQQSEQQLMFISCFYVHKFHSRRKRLIFLRKLMMRIKNVRVFEHEQMIEYLNEFVSELIPYSNSSQLSNQIRKMFHKKAKGILLNFADPKKYLQRKLPVENQQALFNTVYQSVYSLNQRIKSYQKLRAKYDLSKKQEEKSPEFKLLYDESLRLRQVSQEKQFQLLCLKVFKQKGKRFGQISWIQQLNV